MKRKNEQRIKRKMGDIKARNKRIKKSQRRVKILRNMRRTEKGKIREAMGKTKTHNYEMTKLDEKRNFRLKSEMKRRNWEEKKKQTKTVKEQLEIAGEKRKQFELQRLEKARKEFDDKINKEIKVTKAREKEVMQMEMIEMELIKKLQNTQNIQKAAYQDLENALAQPSAFFGNQRPQKNRLSIESDSN